MLVFNRYINIRSSLSRVAGYSRVKGVGSVIGYTYTTYLVNTITKKRYIW